MLLCDIESADGNFGILKIRQRWRRRVEAITNSRAEKRARTMYIGGIFLESSEGEGVGREERENEREKEREGKKSIGRPRVMTETSRSSFNLLPAPSALGMRHAHGEEKEFLSIALF